ncbi:MAG: hypothetical protein V2A63_01615 [Patescibacteria group bacterium]
MRDCPSKISGTERIGFGPLAKNISRIIMDKANELRSEFYGLNEIPRTIVDEIIQKLLSCFVRNFEISRTLNDRSIPKISLAFECLIDWESLAVILVNAFNEYGDQSPKNMEALLQQREDFLDWWRETTFLFSDNPSENPRDEKFIDSHNRLEKIKALMLQEINRVLAE